MALLSREDWDRLFDQFDSPSVGQAAEALADARDIGVFEACGVIEDVCSRDPPLNGELTAGWVAFRQPWQVE